MENEARVNAAMAELNALIQSLIQRNINLAGDLAVALTEIETLKQSRPVVERHTGNDDN